MTISSDHLAAGIEGASVAATMEMAFDGEVIGTWITKRFLQNWLP
jgi:hypothetical protein